MKRRLSRCRCLVGWRDLRMTEPILCGNSAKTFVEEPRVGICADHAYWLGRKPLTVVLREVNEGTLSPKMVKLPKGTKTR